MNYKEAMEYLDSIKGLGIRPGLDSIRELCKRLQNPQDGVKFVHVAGTNGKGSVIAYISAVLKAAGYKTGCYISPAVFDYCEKIKVNGRNIPQKQVCAGLEEIRRVCGEMVDEGFSHPTVFEVETALAFWYFRQKGCDFAVIETGMGGLNDATNVVTTTVLSVITSVSMDHMAFLGNTKAEIATQKAGIIKAGIPVVSSVQDKEVTDVIKNRAELLKSDFVQADMSELTKIRYGITRQSFYDKVYGKIEIRLAGRYQIENAALALLTLKVLGERGFEISGQAVREGFLSAEWPGRFSVIARRPLFIIDGAHNEDAAKKLADSIQFYFTNKRIIYIMGVLRDKEYTKVIRATHSFADQIITVTPPDNPRALSAYELAQEVAKVHPRVSNADSLAEAVEMSRLLAGKEDVIIAFGSLSFLGRLSRIVCSGEKKI